MSHKKYWFPLIYAVLLACSLIVPVLGDLAVVLAYPVGIPIFFASMALGGPRDTAVPTMIAGLAQFFIIGVIWDRISNRINRENPHR